MEIRSDERQRLSSSGRTKPLLAGWDCLQEVKSGKHLCFHTAPIKAHGSMGEVWDHEASPKRAGERRNRGKKGGVPKKKDVMNSPAATNRFEGKMGDEDPKLL